MAPTGAGLPSLLLPLQRLVGQKSRIPTTSHTPHPHPPSQRLPQHHSWGSAARRDSSGPPVSDGERPSGWESRGREGRRAGFTSFWPVSTFASVRLLIIAFNRDKEQLLMMLPLILTCSCPSSAAALPCRSPANWESCSAYRGLPADGG